MNGFQYFPIRRLNLSAIRASQAPQTVMPDVVNRYDLWRGAQYVYREEPHEAGNVIGVDVTCDEEVLTFHLARTIADNEHNQHHKSVEEERNGAVKLTTDDP